MSAQQQGARESVAGASRQARRLEHDGVVQGVDPRVRGVEGKIRQARRLQAKGDDERRQPEEGGNYSE